MTLIIVFVLYALALNLLLWRVGLHSMERSTEVASTKKPNRILIIGATGGTGRQLVKQALERGYSVTALVRNPSKLGVEHQSLTVIRGDVLDAETVAAAIKGQDAVVSALGHKRFFYPTRILSDGTRNILKAMEANSVRRFVCETALGIGDTAGRMGLLYSLIVIPFVLPFYFFDKTRQEKLIAASNLDWVIVRPGALTNGIKRGTFQHGRGVGSFIKTVRISRSDVADFMLNQLESDDYLVTAPGVSW
ncbi:MAG: SDR family oxidoreductase [Pyrinomonadaceae bacterium]